MWISFTVHLKTVHTARSAGPGRNWFHGKWRKTTRVALVDCSYLSVKQCMLVEFLKDHLSGCLSLPLFPSLLPEYTMVCGKMSGYQKGSNDAFISGNSNINDPYVDGVSITRGTPRQHIWTYAIGWQETVVGTVNRSVLQCPCNTGASQNPPVFVGSDYFCESGGLNAPDTTIFYAADPLWNGNECGDIETDCCVVPGQPWFHRVLDSPTTDYIEMRLCIDEPTSNENVLISSYEIYVMWMSWLPVFVAARKN